MILNADFETRTLVHAAALEWVSSPAKGVERRMLFRIGDEKARATSIVRYAPGSRFARHGHPGGEEFLVLDGTFQDEVGDYPAGSYIRNPPGSGHAPGSDAGCTIFVKLWQFAADDLEHVVCLPGEGKPALLRPGVVASHVLFESPSEHVLLEEWKPQAEVTLDNPKGLELLVLAGGFRDGANDLGEQSWLRLPAGMPLRVRVGRDGARVWFKAARLLHGNVCAFEPHT